MQGNLYLCPLCRAPSPLSLCAVHSMYTPCGVHALLGRHLLMEATVVQSELELQHKHRHLHTDPATNTISYPPSLSLVRLLTEWTPHTNNGGSHTKQIMSQMVGN